MPELGRRVRVQSVEGCGGFMVNVTFDDGACRRIDLEPYLHGPVFETIRRDADVFRDMRVEYGTITWSNGADIDPDVLYYGLEPARLEPEPAGQL
jgi:hypothetical protein